MINKIFKIIAISIMFTGVVQADLAPLSDHEMSSLTGQALLRIEETAPLSGQPNISFTRLTMGLKIEANQTIDELVIGRYHRDNGTGSCLERGRFCDNAGAAFPKWNCSASECGGLTADVFPDGDTRNPFSGSAVVYGDLLELTGGERFSALWGALFGGDKGAYDGGKPFTDTNVFPSGFEYTTDADIKLRDVSLGRVIHVDENGNKDVNGQFRQLEPFVIEKPFVEFAYDTSDPLVRKIAGLRVGFGSASGAQGNAIDVLTGFVKPVVSAKATVKIGEIAISADFTFAPYLGGVRTPGYIDAANSVAGPCSGGFLSSVICDKVETPTLIAHASPQAQLFPLQNVALKDSPSFWFSFQNQTVQYASDKVRKNGEDYEIVYEEAQPGAWINLGAFGLNKKVGNSYVPIDFNLKDSNGNAVNNLNLLTQVSGFSANTTQPRHPDNYFGANVDNNRKYPQTNNYY